ncbi:hypothetical protein BN14_11965 [Rhizoctonia solani AG-1 IB]|uniref:Uncharacterized protein n=1 Tax=Thanatephorus cucumeris (strain AG1-IB / isolate 7/3/14) TaxID=1108050 RepID=M5CEY1_THACB|nr:hypothetical protein BN14_11965 [Rhizoctonia solani AG-1 IB]
MARFSAIEFALCVLSMFGRVIDENRIAVQVLLEAIKSYNPSTRTFGKQAAKQVGYGARSSLRAFAMYLGKTYNMKQLRTEDGAQAILHTILDPVIGSLTAKELARLKKGVPEAARQTWCVGEGEVRTAVCEFLVKAWREGRREYWLGVWQKGNEGIGASGQGDRAEDVSNGGDQPTVEDQEVPGSELPSDYAVVPMMATLKRRARVARISRCGSFPSAVDVCLGLGSLGSNHWCMDKDAIWHPHGWKLFYPAEFSSLYREETAPTDFRFPPPGMLSSTTEATKSPKSGHADAEQTMDMTRKLRQWEDEWEKRELGAWKAATYRDSALWYIAEHLDNSRMQHAHGWKKFDKTARSAHKETGYRFPLGGSGCWTPELSSGATSAVDSIDTLETEGRYKKWEEKWEAEQLGKWADGLKSRARGNEVGLWKRLVGLWKSGGGEWWTGIGGGADEVDDGDMERAMDAPRTLRTKFERLVGLA